MNTYIANRSLLALMLACVISIHSNASLFSSEARKITILHTNDHHGHFWHNRHGEFGMAARATLINQIREEVKQDGGSVLLLSGGDINTGTPESDMQDAEPDFIGMNLLKYDAMAVGNHEFDNPLSVLLQQEKWANFPFLAANIYKDGKRLFKPYHVFEKSGLIIAVIGLTTEQTANIGAPEFIKGIDFRNPKVETADVIQHLKRFVHPDIIIAATHMGHYANVKNDAYESGDVALARFLQEGDLDLIVGGHSQNPVCMAGENTVDVKHKPGTTCVPDQQNGTYIVQAHDWGKYVGRADFEYIGETLELVNYQLIPVNLKQSVKLLGQPKRVFYQEEIEKDPAVFKALEPYKKKGQAKLDTVFGTTTDDLIGERSVIRNQQTNLGRLLATAQMKRVNADFGIVNAGGVRASIAKGDITYRDILTVQPFANTVGMVEMSGAEIIAYLDVVATIKPGSGGYAQFTNIAMTISDTGVRDVKIAGSPLNPSRSYRFSIPSYNAAGGNNYPKITEHTSYFDSGYTDADALKHYVMQLKTINAKIFNPMGDIRYE